MRNIKRRKINNTMLTTKHQTSSKFVLEESLQPLALLNWDSLFTAFLELLVLIQGF